LTQALALGDLREAQGREFKKLGDYVWTIEQYLRQHLPKVDVGIERLGRSLGVKVVEDIDLSALAGGGTARRGRNLFRNGDFRLWRDGSAAQKSTDGDFHFVELSAGFFLLHDGGRSTCRVSRLKWTENAGVIPYGKTFLHVESDDPVRRATFFALSYVIPSALLIAGRPLCVSGASRLVSHGGVIHVGGRYDLGPGRRLEWPDRRVSLGRSMARWATVLDCPRVEPTEIALGHSATILVKLPFDHGFSFDLTDLQIEIGDRPTEFEYL
jgi:hypothetical protein